MQFEIPAVYIASSVIGIAVLGWNLFLRSKFNSIKILFDKVDEVKTELTDYKLHVAETYVNQQRLTEQLAPLKKSIDTVLSKILKTE